MEGQINIHKLAKVLSEIFSDKYGAKVTITIRPKEPQQSADAAKGPAKEA